MFRKFDVVKIASFIVLLIAMHTSVIAQQYSPEEKLILGDSLVFMGFDFSEAKMIEPAKVSLGIYIRDKHGADWSEVDDMLVARQDMKYDFQKKVVITALTWADSSYHKLDEKWVVDKYAGLQDTAIIRHLHTYPAIGRALLGLVLIVDRMDVKNKCLYICAVYFDMSKYKPIKIIRTSGTFGGSLGYTPWFDTALESAYHNFIAENDKYIKALKKVFGVSKK